MIRTPVVAGSFYPAEPDLLTAELDRLLVSPVAPSPATAVIVPHAGYVYSGAVAGELLAATAIPKTVILLGPNHQGTGHDIALTGASSWATPLGEVPIHDRLRTRILQEVAGAEIDERAHQAEHSLEVMLPLLLKRQPDLRIVPISLRSLDFSRAAGLGSALAAIIQRQDEDVLLLASSDMNHFQDAETTRQLDFMAISAMADFDPQRLYQTVVENRISMCGMLPAVVVMQAARQLGASDCRLVRYAHSGQVNGDDSRVVGYAALSMV
jgi:AmmeMemoRadiSam system protein B